MGGVDYTYTPSMHTSMVLYTAGQYTKRKHYTGISPDSGQELQDFNNAPPYGDSKNHTIQFGAQLNHAVNDFIGSGTNILTFGAEYMIDDVFDKGVGGQMCLLRCDRGRQYEGEE